MNILVVDDNPANLLFAAEILRERSWNVVEAAGGLEAMVEFETGDFDLVVADIRMPHLSGDQLLTWIQTEERFSNTRVIACTAHAQADDVRRMLAAGFDMVLIKPITADQLLKAADACLARPPVRLHARP
jgi:CheY-like chemotaxis protein